MPLRVPNLRSALVDKMGRLIPPWNSFFQQFTQPPTDIQSVTVGASPFSYMATEPGTLIVTGGTVSAISLVRGTITIAFNPAIDRIFPMSFNDTITVTYTVAPAIKFVPEY